MCSVLADFRAAGGDLHGRLVSFLLFISFISGSRNEIPAHILLGDYVDRGREQLELLCCLAQNKVKAGPSCQMIPGNHDVSNSNKCCYKY